MRASEGLGNAPIDGSAWLEGDCNRRIGFRNTRPGAIVDSESSLSLRSSQDTVDVEARPEFNQAITPTPSCSAAFRSS